MSDRITEKRGYGYHIPLRCVDHPEKRWSTKNISPIGCRTLFYNLDDTPGMGPECNCPADRLEVVESEC